MAKIKVVAKVGTNIPGLGTVTSISATLEGNRYYINGGERRLSEATLTTEMGLSEGKKGKKKKNKDKKKK